MLGSDPHPDVAKQLNNLALLCQNQGKVRGGRGNTRGPKIYESKLGQDDPNVAKTKNNLACPTSSRAQYQEAEVLSQAGAKPCPRKWEFGAIDEKNKTIWQIIA